MATSPTPSEENLVNSRDDCVHAAINVALSQKQQSYDEFLKSFPHLNIEDKDKLSSGEAEMSTSPPGFIPRKTRLYAGDRPSVQSRGKTVPVSATETVPSADRDTLTEDIDLEEEVLAEGETRGRLSDLPHSQTATTVKFDNFVEEEEEENESAYLASFHDDAKMKEKQSVKGDTGIQSDGPENSQQIAKSVSSNHSTLSDGKTKPKIEGEQTNALPSAGLSLCQVIQE